MKFLVWKAGVLLSQVFVRVDQSGTIFWVASRKRATEFNLTKARKVARQEGAQIVTSN